MEWKEKNKPSDIHRTGRHNRHFGTKSYRPAITKRERHHFVLRGAVAVWLRPVSFPIFMICCSSTRLCHQQYQLARVFVVCFDFFLFPLFFFAKGIYMIVLFFFCFFTIRDVKAVLLVVPPVARDGGRLAACRWCCCCCCGVCGWMGITGGRLLRCWRCLLLLAAELLVTTGDVPAGRATTGMETAGRMPLPVPAIPPYASKWPVDPPYECFSLKPLAVTGSDFGDDFPSPPQNADSGRGRSLDKLLPLRLPPPPPLLPPTDLSRFISPMMPITNHHPMPSTTWLFGFKDFRVD